MQDHKHSFIGRSLSQYLYDFEPDDGLGDPPAADPPVDPPADPPADADGAADPPVTDDELEDADAAFQVDWASPDAQGALRGALQDVLGGMMQPPNDPGYGQLPQLPDLPELDIYDPESVVAHLEAREERLMAANAYALAEALQSVIGPYQPVLQQNARQQWEAETDAFYDPLEKQVGPADRATVRAIAAGLDTLGLVQQGQNPHDVAYRGLASLIKEAKQQGVEEYKQSLSRDSTLLDPPAHGSGVGGEAAPSDELAAARQWAARRAAGAA